MRVGVDDLDEGYFAQQALRVLHGQLPYRDFDSLYTPGLAYLHAGVFAALGGPSLVGMRAVGIAFRAATVFLLYVLGRPFVRNTWWAAAPAVVLLALLDDSPVRWEPHPGWASSFFALFTIWCLSHRTTTLWLIFGGAGAALSYAFKQNTGVFILMAALLWCRRSKWYFALAVFASVSTAWSLPLAMAVGDVRQLGPLVGAVNQAGLASPPEMSLLLPLAALVAGIWLARRDSDPRLRWYLFGGTALLLTQFPRMDTLHLVWSAPMLLVVGAIALDRLRAWLAAAVLGAIVLLLSPTWLSRLTYVAEPRDALAGIEAPVPTVAELRGAIAEIDARSSPDEPIFVYPSSPLLYVLAARPNPTRFDHLNPGAADPRQIEQLVADLSRADVRLVVISDFWQEVWGPPGANAALEEFLAGHYAEVARHGSYRALTARL